MTRASDEKPTRRVVKTRDATDLVAELGETTLALRPPGARRGGPAEVTIGLGLLYQRLLLGSNANAAKPTPTRRGR